VFVCGHCETRQRAVAATVVTQVIAHHGCRWPPLDVCTIVVSMCACTHARLGNETMGDDDDDDDDDDGMCTHLESSLARAPMDIRCTPTNFAGLYG
jgi:hypothetical protein